MHVKTMMIMMLCCIHHHAQSINHQWSPSCLIGKKGKEVLIVGGQGLIHMGIIFNG